MHAALAAIADVALGRVEALGERFDAALVAPPEDVGEPDAWEVALAPVDAELRRELRSIRVYGSGRRLAGLRTDRGAKGWRHLQLLPVAVHGGSSSSP